MPYGFVESVAPIKMNDITIGYIMFGQILETNTNKSEVLAKAYECLGASKELELAFENLNVLSYEEIHSIANIMEMISHI